jgi:hypothetical protein
MLREDCQDSRRGFQLRELSDLGAESASAKHIETRFKYRLASE